MNRAYADTNRAPAARVIFPLFALCLLAGSTGLLRSAPPRGLDHAKPPVAQRDKLSTVTYDVADLVRKPTPWRMTPILGVKAEGDAMDALAKVILTAVHPERWGSGENASSLQEHNGTKLEIRTDAAHHAEIKALLTALRRLADCAVVLEGELYEVDRDFYKKEIEPRLEGAASSKRFATPIEDDVAKRLRAKAVRLNTNKVTIPNGSESKLLSSRKAFTYVAKLKGGNRKLDEILGTGFYGVSFQARVVVSADRQSVRLNLTQHVTDLIDIKKETAVDPETGQEGRIEVPHLLHTSVSGAIQVGDGISVLLPIQSRPQAVKGKEYVRLLLVTPVIYIEEEERAKAANGS
jgi:hypothetical protein